jgi:tRNA pseudouridine55 synthase
MRRNEDGTCDVRARVVCSAGTYVRALAESFGENLGAGAHLAALRRTRAGRFDLSRAVTPERLQALAESGSRDFLLPMEAALPDMPAAHLNDEEARKARHGAAARATALSPEPSDGEHLRVLDAAGALIAVGVYDAARGLIRPRVMLAPEK